MAVQGLLHSELSCASSSVPSSTTSRVGRALRTPEKRRAASLPKQMPFREQLCRGSLSNMNETLLSTEHLGHARPHLDAALESLPKLGSALTLSELCSGLPPCPIIRTAATQRPRCCANCKTRIASPLSATEPNGNFESQKMSMIGADEDNDDNGFCSLDCRTNHFMLRPAQARYIRNDAGEQMTVPRDATGMYGAEIDCTQHGWWRPRADTAATQCRGSGPSSGMVGLREFAQE